MSSSFGYGLVEATPPPKQSLNFPTMNEIQETAIKLFMSSPTRHASVVAPVGVGKTLMALFIWDRLGRPNTLIVVPRIVLIQNPWLNEMQRVGIATESVGEYYSEKKEIKYPITITLYQTLVSSPHLIKNFDFVIFDEEQSLSGNYANLLDEVVVTRSVLGMTGTFAEAAQQNPRLEQILPIVFESSIAQAREGGMLARAEIVPVYVELSEKEMVRYKNLISDYDSILKQARGTKNRSHFKSAFIVKQEINQILSNTAPKIARTIEIIESDPSIPTLVFSLSIKSIEVLAERLAEKGIRAQTITHELQNRALRQEIVDGFGKNYNVLLSVATLEIGFNVPNAGREILMASTGRLTRTEQRLGRVLRRDPRNPDKIAKVYVEIAIGTLDHQTLRAVNRAYTRLDPKGSVSQGREAPERSTRQSSEGRQTTLS